MAIFRYVGKYLSARALSPFVLISALPSLPFICTQLKGSSTIFSICLVILGFSGSEAKQSFAHRRMSAGNNNQRTREKKMNDIDCWDSDALAPWYTHLVPCWNEWAVHIHFYTNCLNCNSQRCARSYASMLRTWTRLRPLTFTKMPNSTVIK